MRIRVFGDSPTATALRGNLSKAGFRVSKTTGMFSMGYTVHIQEYPGAYIHVDGVDCELERNMVNGIAGLTETPILLQRAGGVQSDQEIRIRVPLNDEDQKAVELGVVRGMLRTANMEDKSSKSLKLPKTSNIGLAIAILAILMLFTISLKAQQLANTVTRLFPGVPTDPCTAFQIAKNAANGHFYSCNQSTLLWVDIGPATGGGTVTDVTGTPPIASTGGATPDISISQSGVASDGYLSSVDWGLFNAKQPAISTHAAVANNFLTGFTAPNTFTAAQPSCSNLSDAGTGCSGTSYPGLVAHDILSASHGDTTAAAVQRADLITGQGASPTWTRLAKGGAGECLQMDGTATDIIWDACAAGGFPRLDQVLDPTADKTFAMTDKMLSFTWGSATGSNDLFTIQNGASDTGTGALLAVNMDDLSQNHYALHVGPPESTMAAFMQGWLYPVAAQFNAKVSDTSTTVSGTAVGVEAQNTTSGNVGAAIEVAGMLEPAADSSATEMRGLTFQLFTHGSKNAGSLQGIKFSPTHYAAGSLDQIVGVGIDTAAFGVGSGNVGTYYGMKIENLTGAQVTNAYAIKTGLGAVDFGDTVKGASTINAVTGFQINGAGTLANVLRGDGTNFVSAALSCADLSDEGTGCAGAAYPGLVAHNLLSASHGDTVAASPVLGDMLYGNVTPAWTKLAGNTTTTKQWLSQTGTGAVSAAPSWSDVKLDELSNPSGNKTFTMATKAIQFTFTNPSNAPTYDGAFEIEATGAFTGDLLHVHQHTGNPGAGTDLVHLEAADSDVVPLNITGAYTYSIVANKPIDITVATGTAPLTVASTTEVANLRSATATALAADPSDCGANTLANAIAASGNLTCRAVVEADISLSDNTTDDVSTTKHGFVPKGTNTGKFLRDDGTWQTVSASLPSGLIVFIASGTCPAGFTEVAGLAGKFVLGTTAAGGDVGTTGGSSSYTPAGTNAASAVSGIVVDAHASHTHTYTEVPNHVHPENGPSSASGGALTLGIDTNASGNQATGSNTANPTGGVATATTNGPSASLTHNVSNNGTAAAQTFTGTPATITPPYIKLIGCSSN